MPIIIDQPSGLPVPRRTDRAPRNKRQGRVPGPADVAKIDAQVLRDPGVHATPADFGSGVGQSVEAFGAAAFRVASDFAEMRREAEDATAAAAALAEARVRFVRVSQGLEDRATSGEGFADALDNALSAETDAILGDLRDVRGLRPSDAGVTAIRRQLAGYRARVVARGAIFEHDARLNQLGGDVDRTIGDHALAAYNRPADYLGILAEAEASLDRFKDKLPPDALAAKLTTARESIAHSTVAGLIELDPALAIRGLKEGVFDDDLPAADRKRLRARAGAAQRDRRAQAERGQIRDRAAAGADGARRLVVLEGAIARGEAGEQAIAEAADILDDPTRARLRESLDARRAADAARDRRIEKVSAVLAGRAPATGGGDGKPDGDGDSGDADLRPGAPGWRQAVDDHYASLADALETMDPETRARFEDDYARATGVLPEAVAKRLRAGLLSADAAGQAAAAQRLARLRDVDSALVSAIPANDRRRAQAIAEFAALGLPPARAVELAAEKLAGVGEDDQPAGGAGDDALAAGGPGDDTPDKDVTEDELIERIAALSEEVLNLAETGRQEAGAEDEPLVMANVKVLLTILRSIGKLLGRKPGQEATREGAKRTAGEGAKQAAREAAKQAALEAAKRVAVEAAKRARESQTDPGLGPRFSKDGSQVIDIMPEEAAKAAALKKNLAPLSDETAPTPAVFDLANIRLAKVVAADQIPAYVRDVVKAKGAAQPPRFIFNVGELPRSIADHAAIGNAEFGDVSSRQLRLSNEVIDKLYHNSPKIADRLLADLPDILTAAKEVLPDHQNANRALITRPFRGLSGKSRNQVAVIEVARTKDGFEIVSIHTSPNRTLDKARNLLKKLLKKNGRGG